jgi:hypothetical protein
VEGHRGGPMLVPVEVGLRRMAPAPEASQGVSPGANGIIPQKTLVVNRTVVLNRIVLNRSVPLQLAPNRPA